MLYYIDGFQQFKRNAWGVMDTLLSSMLLSNNDPTRILSNVVLTQRFYHRIVEQLETEPEKVLKAVGKLWSRIVTPNNTKVYLAADANLMVKISRAIYSNIYHPIHYPIIKRKNYIIDRKVW